MKPKMHQETKLSKILLSHKLHFWRWHKYGSMAIQKGLVKVDHKHCKQTME